LQSRNFFNQRQKSVVIILPNSRWRNIFI
jgi:hypothetical protein